jgi:ribosomal protein S18 acetylase RimI-like enzyme
MRMFVRPAVPEDWPVIVDFNCRLALESEGKRLELADVEPGVKSLLADPRKGRYFVAVAEPFDAQRSADAPPPGLPWPRGRESPIVGQLMHTFEWSDWRNGEIWWLQSVYVDPEFRRRGVFRALFDHLRTEAEADPNVVGLRLYVEEQNARAHTTYEKLGLKPGGYFVMEHMLRRSNLSP